MELLTDGSENNPILGFCLRVISRHADTWPPPEEILAQEFVKWLGFSSFLTRDGLQRLCQLKGVTLSFAPLPEDIRGFNCAFQERKEIVITERKIAPFSDAHTLLHELREIVEYVFTELRYPTIGAQDYLEGHAEHFAVVCRMQAAEQELPVFLEKAQNIENKWARYLAYGFLAIFAAAYYLGCAYAPQMENFSEARQQRYVRT